jgi:hypothetical protein
MTAKKTCKLNPADRRAARWRLQLLPAAVPGVGYQIEAARLVQLLSRLYLNRRLRLLRFDRHRCHAGVLKPTLGGNREYFHSQTAGNADGL